MTPWIDTTEELRPGDGAVDVVEPRLCEVCGIYEVEWVNPDALGHVCGYCADRYYVEGEIVRVDTWRARQETAA